MWWWHSGMAVVAWWHGSGVVAWWWRTLMEYMAVDLDALPAPSVSGTALPAVHTAVHLFQSAMIPATRRESRSGARHGAA